MQIAAKELEAFGALQRKLGLGVMDAVVAAVKKPWKELYLDVRSHPGQTAHKTKLRVIPVSGTLISVTPPAEVTITIIEILQMRSSFAEEPWSGMKVTMNYEGQCKVEFNYDPNCVDDPAFFKD